MENTVKDFSPDVVGLQDPGHDIFDAYTQWQEEKSAAHWCNYLSGSLPIKVICSLKTKTKLQTWLWYTASLMNIYVQ